MWLCPRQLFLIAKKKRKETKQNKSGVISNPAILSPKFKRGFPLLNSLSLSDSSSFLSGILLSASSSFESYHTSLLLRVCALKSFGFV
jgi:hypothetical protein